ncbi:MAG: phosphatidylserine decarboxylase [Acidobacteriaceae bacterium]
MVRDGFFYGLGFAIVAVIAWYVSHMAWLVAVPVVLAMFFLWFFRDPSRQVPDGAGLIVSPADGKVEELEWIEFPDGGRLRLTIFLNVFDVHVNRVPVGGVVTLCEHNEGRFMNAMNPESAIHNEQTLIAIDAGGYTVSFKQIAGLLARRIVNNLKVGDHVERGQRMGLIKFGSRVDVLMPAETEPRVKVGDRVKGGSSILGQLPQGGQS